MAGKKKSGKLREANALSLGDKTTRRGKEPAVGPAVTDEGSSSERKSAPRAARRTKPVAKMLYEFWGRAERRVGEQYEGARERHAEDAGTRGDQGEEDWASVLREWLPPRFRVVTKGRLAGSPGIRHATGLSGQLDLFVLHPDYPAALEREKLYLMEGVVAAFECKARVTAGHVAEAVATGYQLAAIEELPFAPTPSRYMNRRVFFGLLGHTHSWRGTTERKLRGATKALADAHARVVTHPRQMLDALCIADLGFWKASKTLLRGEDRLPSGAAGASYMLHRVKPVVESDAPPLQTNVGRLIAALWKHLARHDPAASALWKTADSASPVGGLGPWGEFPRALPRWMVEEFRRRGPCKPWEHPPGWEHHW